MNSYLRLVVVAGSLFVPSAALAVDLFTDDFDLDHTANWTVNSGPTDCDAACVALDPINFKLSNSASFFFDYSVLGIPSAPNSTGGTTRGLKIMANQDGDFNGIPPALTGISVSPTGQDFSTAGNYKLTFDWWANYNGPGPAGGNGTTQMSTFGIATSGTAANYAGTADGIFFASTLDGGSAADYRVYSKERVISYQVPTLIDANSPPDLDDLGNPIDLHANHLAKTRNSSPPQTDYDDSGSMDTGDYVRWRKNLGTSPILTTDRLKGNGDFDTDVDQDDYNAWRSLFGSIGLYKETFGLGTPLPAAQATLFSQQTGTTALGSPAFAWHAVEISKVGNLVSWTVNGKVLITLDLTNYATIGFGALGGGNIMLGHADTNTGASNDVNRFDLLFTLIDNVKVSTNPPGSGALNGGAVPEPGAIVLALMGLAFAAGRRCR